MTRTRRRAVIAALVAVLGASVGVAGAGHLYLRRWRRAAAWFAFVIGAAIVLLWAFVDPSTVALADPAAIASLDPGSLPATVTAPIFGLLMVSTVDAYRLAIAGPQTSDGLQCPNCGGDLDPEIDFCPWCTIELEWEYPETEE
ncbi:zinc ribbon domain-containing protein [Halobellus captivus]|uniref:zinc ribbon domain-containing protein n=1 Tax=Halobellus captivus TaxID=2592614 RepID=UPI0011A53726|nr:zinc ribbon domain-containing protein [Halobellus captivus]